MCSGCLLGFRRNRVLFLMDRRCSGGFSYGSFRLGFWFALKRAFLGFRRHLSSGCGLGGRSCGTSGTGAIDSKVRPNEIRDVVIERAGMRFLLGYAERGQQFDDLVGGNLQLPGQLVDADFTHMGKTAMGSKSAA